jgi:hypothetical protein
MEHEQVTREIARRSARFYLPISVGAALLFLLAASLTGDYPLVARLGGSVWVGLLTLIVTTPLVTSWVKERSLQAP